ncbi:MAG: hypothetical protein K6L81_17665 [Agarilytica sp.]
MACFPPAVSTAFCAVCCRPPSGYGWRLPSQRYQGLNASMISLEDQHASYRRFCSKQCQDIFTHAFHKGITMSPEQHADLAEQATLPPLGDYVVQVGMDKGLGHYTKAEIQGLVKTIVDAYHQKLKDIYSEDIPF